MGGASAPPFLGVILWLKVILQDEEVLLAEPVV